VTQTVVRRLLNLPEKHLSRPTIEQRLARDYKILIQAYPSRSYGKLEHIQKCITRIEQLSLSCKDIQAYHVAFFDDHPMNIKEAKKYFPAALLPVEEFNRQSRTIEPLIPLIDRLVEQSWNEYEKSNTKRKYSRGDR
jgi:predicted metal-dependent HD superfamily phosphohydrolase